MIGVDTNLLVRVFAGDDAQQRLAASRLLDQSGSSQIFVNVVVLVEFAWTMRRTYKWDDDWIRQALNMIVRHPALVIQHRDSVLEAISESNTGLAGFADRLIAAMNHEAGCDVTITFDKDAAGSDGFKELET
jgi:predicted nucleic-acid-binding protein